MKDHDVMFDRAGWGNYPRLTCLTCDATCLKKAYTDLRQWGEAVKEFNREHPSKTGSKTLEAIEQARKAISEVTR